MRSPLVQLLTARRFAPLFVTQFLGAFNDNLLKSAMGIVVTFRLAEQSGMDSASLVMLAGAVFIAPFFLFSGASGTLADRVDKSYIARIVKVAEIVIMTVGAVGLWLESVPLLFAALFFLGTHSTVFGPIKYALLPQHLHEDELVAGNALIEAGTFLAILFGTILGGSVVLLAQGALVVGGCGVVCALLGWVAARQIPPAPSSAADAPRPRLLRDTIAVVGHVTSRPALLLPILAVSWFWLFGATVVSGLPAFAKDVLFANEQVVTMMLALFAVGVGVGSIVAERLLHGEVSARFVPIAAAAMAFFAWDLHAASAGRPPVPELATVSAFLSSQGSWRILVDLVGVAMAGGLFTVPLYAILQHESEPAHRARVIAANNIINALAMAIAAVGAAALLARGLTMGELFALCGLLTIPVALVAAWILRRAMAKSLLRLILRVLYRVKVEGLEHARAALPKAVIAANHASFLDGLLLGAFLPGGSDLRRRHPDLEAVVGEAVPHLRQRAAGRSDEPALHPRDDPGSGSRLGLHHFSGRPHHDDRILDEGVRRTRGHCRAHEGRAPARAHRRCGVHAVLSPGRQGPSTPVSADSPAHPAAAPADGARRCDRPRPSRRVAPRARRRDGAVDVRGRSHRHHPVRRAARRESPTRQQPHRGRRSRDASLELPGSHHGQLCAWRCAGAADACGRTRRRVAADVARGARHLLRAAGRAARAGDAQLLDRRGVGDRRVSRCGDRAHRHGARVHR